MILVTYSTAYMASTDVNLLFCYDDDRHTCKANFINSQRLCLIDPLIMTGMSGDKPLELNCESRISLVIQRDPVAKRGEVFYCTQRLACSCLHSLNFSLFPHCIFI